MKKDTLVVDQRSENITHEMRVNALVEPVAQKLFATMSDKVVTAIEEAFLGQEYEGENVEAIKSYFAFESFITRAVNRRAASGVAFQYLYNKYAFSAVDKYFCDCAAGHQIYRRLVSIQQNLPDIIRENFGDQDKIVIFNVGSAQGYDMIDVLHKNSDLAAKCHVINIDPDDVALAQGWDRIVQLGLQDNFEFFPHELKDAPREKADLIITSGIYCILNLRESRIAMKQMSRNYLRKDGLILYNSSTYTALTSDPLCDYLMKIHQWNMYYKTIEEIVKIGSEAKLTPVSNFADDKGFNVCAIARK